MKREDLSPGRLWKKAMFSCAGPLPNPCFAPCGCEGATRFQEIRGEDAPPAQLWKKDHVFGGFLKSPKT